MQGWQKKESILSPGWIRDGCCCLVLPRNYPIILLFPDPIIYENSLSALKDKGNYKHISRSRCYETRNGFTSTFNRNNVSYIYCPQSPEQTASLLTLRDQLWGLKDNSVPIAIQSLAPLQRMPA